MHWSHVSGRRRCNTRPSQNNSIFFGFDKTEPRNSIQTVFVFLIVSFIAGAWEEATASNASVRPKSSLSRPGRVLTGGIRYDRTPAGVWQRTDRRFTSSINGWVLSVKTAETFKPHKPAQEAPANKTDTTMRLETNVLLIFLAPTSRLSRSRDLCFLSGE